MIERLKRLKDTQAAEELVSKASKVFETLIVAYKSKCLDAEQSEKVRMSFSSSTAYKYSVCLRPVPLQTKAYAPVLAGCAICCKVHDEL